MHTRLSLISSWVLSTAASRSAWSLSREANRSCSGIAPHGNFRRGSCCLSKTSAVGRRELRGGRAGEGRDRPCSLFIIFICVRGLSIPLFVGRGAAKFYWKARPGGLEGDDSTHYAKLLAAQWITSCVRRTIELVCLRSLCRRIAHRQRPPFSRVWD